MAVNIAWNWRRWASLGLWNPDRGKQYAEPQLRGPTASRAEINDARSLQVSAVFSCIRIIAETVASLPICVYERQANGTRREIRDHWLAELLDKPNELMTGEEYREAVSAALAGWGNSVSEVARTSAKRPRELWPLKPEGVEIEKPDRFSVQYKYRPTGDTRSEIVYERGDVLHVKGFGTDGIIGLSPLGLARESLGLAVSAEDYAGSFYANGGRPSGVLMSERVLTPDQRTKVRQEFGGIAESTARDGNRLWVLEANLKYQAITISPEDLQMLETRSFQISEIARFFRVPLFLLMSNEKDTSWGSGLEQMDLGFLKYTLRPYLVRIENSLARWLLTPAEQAKYYVEHNVEGLLRADSKSRADFLSQLVNNGLMTRNEGRSKENLPPKDGGDVLTVQSALVPLDQLGKLPEVVPEPPPPSG